MPRRMLCVMVCLGAAGCAPGRLESDADAGRAMDASAPAARDASSSIDAASVEALDGGEEAPAPIDASAHDAGTLADAGTPELEWHRANLTNFTSYPEPGSEECVEYSGCEWAGMFAALDGVQTEEWVRTHDIAAVHSRDFPTYELHTLRLRQDGREIDVVVYDECADTDCDGCCTTNATQHGLDFLIDIERYTMERFGSGDGIVEWACLDC